MTSEADVPFGEAAIEALIAPAVRRLVPPTSLSPLPYDLNAGVPDRATLPAAGLAKAARRALIEDPAGALTYGGQQGYEPLRAWIARRQAEETGLPVTAEWVTLTSGSAHGLDNIAATFVGEGDVVVTGAPTYPGAIRTVRARGAEIVDVPQDDEGMRTEELARVLAEQRATGRPAKVIYVTANYDNPSGSTLPVERRGELIRLAREHGALIVEDDAYTGIDLSGPPPPSLFGMAEGRGIMRAGTFSKTIATGLRVGWVVAQPEITRRLVFMRFDNGSSPFLHRVVLNYIESGSYEPHVEMLRDLYRERRDLSAEILRGRCGELITFRVPAGGFFHWLHLAEGLDAGRVVEAAAERGVAVTPGAGYFANGGGERCIRLVYSALPPRELREAVTRFGDAVVDVASGRSGPARPQ